MAYRLLFRRLSPLLRSGSHLVPALNSALRLPRQAVINQNLAARLTGSRSMSSDNYDKQPEILNIQDEEDFEKRVIGSAKPVVVDFHATWCGPCKLLGPRLETIIAGQKGKVIMAKVDIDENVELAMRYNVQSVPTVYGVKDGKVLTSFIGLKEDDEIKSFVAGLM
ncbi:thioredoxin, mitochondrial-like [Littorina saxatilis]|uniref:Thioredoxin domain-containing protein n=1 Tax=Littorina saxatilis TaxID=31220 RepID=A0AAN9GMG5_9CAEN